MMRALLTALLLLVAAPRPAQDAPAPPVAVSYTMDVTEPESGIAKVEMVVENNRDDEVTIGIPVWAPGAYRVVSYYRGILDLEADVDGKKVEVTPTDHKSLWTVKTGRAKKFTVRYSLKPRSVQPIQGNLSKSHYDIQGPSAWLFVKDRLNGPHQATFKLPKDWKVGTGLSKLGESTYGARDYDTFIDCPTELGTFDLKTFTHDGVPYELVMHAESEFDHDKLIDVCRKIAAEQIRMFGGAPYDRYVFIFHFRTQQGGGGLEHLNSTGISFPMQVMASDPGRIASLVSHEFFHLWNVKRIRPKELGPFDYTQAVRSKALWLCEGVTSYYGDLTLVRSGIWTRDTYLAHLAGEINNLQSNPARLNQSVEEASRTVWDRGRGGQGPAVDYYNKGELLGWLIDLRIRALTGGKKSFDDVMRHIYRTHVVEPAAAGKGAIGVGFEEGGILKAVNEVSGKDFSEFFANYVSGTAELPYADVIKEVGLELASQKTLPVSLQGTRVIVEPAANSVAGKAGFKQGDRIVKIGDTEVANRPQLSKALADFKTGDKVAVFVRREGSEEPIRLELPVTDGASSVVLGKDPSESQKALLQGWLAPSK